MPESNAINVAVPRARRILAILDCSSTDEAIVDSAAECALANGAHLTIVALAQRPLPFQNAGPYCSPVFTREESLACASRAVARAASRVPDEVSFRTSVDEGKPAKAIAQRIEYGAHDLVVMRARRRLPRNVARMSGVPVLAVRGSCALRVQVSTRQEEGKVRRSLRFDRASRLARKALPGRGPLRSAS